MKQVSWFSLACLLGAALFSPEPELTVLCAVLAAFLFLWIVCRPIGHGRHDG
jgi:hypothetical protein